MSGLEFVEVSHVLQRRREFWRNLRHSIDETDYRYLPWVPVRVLEEVLWVLQVLELFSKRPKTVC